MSTICFLISSINYAKNRNLSFINVRFNAHVLLVLNSLYKYRIIESFFVNESLKLCTIFLKYKGKSSTFSSIKLYSSPSRMFSVNKSQAIRIMKKNKLDLFFFNTSSGIKAYRFYDFFILKKPFLGFLLFSIRLS